MKLNIYSCPMCGSVTISYGKLDVACCGKSLQPLQPAEASVRPTVTEMDGEYLLQYDHPMTKDNYIAAVVVERYDQVTLYRLFAEQEALVRVPQVRGARIYTVYRMQDEVKVEECKM